MVIPEGATKTIKRGKLTINKVAQQPDELTGFLTISYIKTRKFNI